MAESHRIRVPVMRTNAPNPQSGDRVTAIDGTSYEMPFAQEHPCFGQRQGWCSNLATWRVDSDYVLLHFCDSCKVRHEQRGKPFSGERWTHLAARPNADALRALRSPQPPEEET